MNVIQLYAALALYLLFNRVEADYSIKVSHQNAIKRCQGSGGLAQSNDFNPVPGTVSYPPEHTNLGLKYDALFDLNLQDGDSAWVAGFASYSFPVVFVDCVVWTENTAKEANGTSIYNCLNSCGYNTSTTDAYIGVNSRYCACLTRDMVNATRVRCDPANDTLLGVYAVETEMVKDEFLYQCNNMQINTSTAKCTEKHSSVCFTRNKEECTNNNRHYIIKDSPICIVSETKTWFDSVNHCKNMSGIIFPDFVPQLVSEVNVRVNDTVGSWVGTFRSFTVADDRTGNGPCLVVTRVNNKLVLEPEDCKKERKYVCLENVRRNRGNNSLIPGIGIGVGAILALFCIIIFFLLIRKIYTKTQTPVITVSATQLQGLNSVAIEQHYDDFFYSDVELRPEPWDGKQLSQSCDGKAITTIGKDEYDEDSNPIRIPNNQGEHFNEDLYSYPQIGHDHVSDGYITCIL